MESLVKEASKELESRLSVDTNVSNTISALNNETQTCINKVDETFELTNKIQTETELINEMLNSLKEKQSELELTFKHIDQLEIIVNKVKESYNAVAENVDSIEKAVSASTRQGKRSDIPVQPYFPPPKPVEIFKSDQVCTMLEF